MARGSGLRGRLAGSPRFKWESRKRIIARRSQYPADPNPKSPITRCGRMATQRRVLDAHLSLYAGYTQGLEDSGVAPSVARNGGSILPVSQTWQADSGARIVLSRQLQIIVGVFELQKPYFNLDASGLDRELGIQQAKGAELSFAGQLLENLNVNAGALTGRVRILGTDLSTEGVGPTAVGQPRLQYSASVNYRFPRLPSMSIDLSALHYGSAPATVDNALYSPAVTELNVGARLKFTILDKNSSLRLQIQNLPNSYRWTNVYTPGLFEWAGPRTVYAYVTTDL